MVKQQPDKVVLFVNGDLPAPEVVQSQIAADDLLIAVDGGLDHLTRLGLTPHLIIGDLDSADPELIEKCRAQGVEIHPFPADKNETDLEIALDAAVALAPASIWVVAALGGRLDQTLANIFLLTRPNLAEYNIRLIDGLTEVFLIRDYATINGKVGERVSLLPLNGPVTGIHTDGLQYPLENETLFPDKTRGISNQMSSHTASISIHSGLLLCTHETTSM